MNLRTLITLALPRSATDRRRLQLLVLSVAVAGAFLLAGLRITRLGFSSDLAYDDVITSSDGYIVATPSGGYSDYLQESGLRGGVALATVFLAATACALAYQALKLGTAARDRRLAAFRLAGATPDQVRTLGAVEGALAGLAGGILAGPVYLVLALLIQALPQVARVLPRPDGWDAAGWPALAILLGAATAVLGSRLRRGLVTDPLAGAEHKPVRVRTGIIGGVVGLVLIVAGMSGLMARAESFGTAIIFVPAAGVLIATITLAPLLAYGQGRRLSRSTDPIKVLAGGRLIRTARTAGRSITLFVLCGTVVGLCAASMVALWREYSTQEGGMGGSLTFYSTGFGLAAFASLAVALAAGASLLAGTADDLVDQRRNLACLSIFGVGEDHLRRSVRLRLTAIATPAVAVGLAVGYFLTSRREVYPSLDSGTALLGLLILVVVGTGLTWLVAAGAAALLRGQVREAIDPQNLRSA
ncbi:hypothetical protein EV644_112101 [Kribbella orskensis]|uniref:FtsX-like permease family protein n=1 Tax=Kribbella orskensis TaxID=2512216 RepID=A0ABY2BEY6_9ACTN|nr:MULTISPECIES: hypothetical protein [Kribbella]TCN36929.1 hypothetical protein EV642_113101 [Kribbella sp. VKM Ac-2500]TCO18353.1 hypothetical protein EV644_112101 [Kribbella orskensis]